MTIQKSYHIINKSVYRRKYSTAMPYIVASLITVTPHTRHLHTEWFGQQTITHSSWLYSVVSQNSTISDILPLVMLSEAMHNDQKQSQQHTTPSLCFGQPLGLTEQQCYRENRGVQMTAAYLPAPVMTETKHVMWMRSYQQQHHHRKNRPKLKAKVQVIIIITNNIHHLFCHPKQQQTFDVLTKNDTWLRLAAYAQMTTSAFTHTWRILCNHLSFSQCACKCLLPVCCIRPLA